MLHFRKQGLYFSSCHHQDRLRLPQIIKSWFLSVWLFFQQFVPLFSHFSISSKLKIGPQAVGLWSSQSLELWFWTLVHVRNTWENRKILIRRSHPSTMKLESLVLRPRLQCFLKSPPAYTTVQLDLRNHWSEDYCPSSLARAGGFTPVVFRITYKQSQITPLQ